MENESLNNLSIFCKTQLSTDQRIQNKIFHLERSPTINQIFVVYLPDADDASKVISMFSDKVKLIEVKSPVRGVKFARVFNAFLFYLKCIYIALKMETKVVICEDFAPVIPSVLLSYLSRVVIYDDHEMPNFFQGGYSYLNLLEKLIISKCSLYTYPSEMRRKALFDSYNIADELEYKCFLLPNHPIPPTFLKCTEINDANTIKANSFIQSAHSKGLKVILHQGPVNSARCCDEIFYLCNNLSPHEYAILFIGLGNELEAVSNRIRNYNGLLDSVFLGKVPADQLSSIWSECDLAIIMYSHHTLNNRYCAPNRLYLAHQFNIPFIYNSSNPVLKDYAVNFGGGVVVDVFLNTGVNAYKSEFDNNLLSELFNNFTKRIEGFFTSQ